jgi:hypothetical protein
MTTLTDILSAMAQALVDDADIDSLCTTTWGQPLTVVRRGNDQFRPGSDYLPLVELRSLTRIRSESNPHHITHPVLVGVFASPGSEPDMSGHILSFPQEAQAEELSWRVERVLTQALSAAGIPPVQDDGGDLLEGAYLVTGWIYNLQIRNILNP